MGSGVLRSRAFASKFMKKKKKKKFKDWLKNIKDKMMREIDVKKK